MDIANAKAVKVWILDSGESRGNTTQNNKVQLQLHCLLSTSSFYIRVARHKRLVFRVRQIGGSGLGAESCRYPLRKRQLTVKAAALAGE